MAGILRAAERAAAGAPETLPRALRLWEAAVAQAPDVSAAHAGLASVWLALGELGWPEAPLEAFRRARAAAGRALALDPGRADAHVVRGAALLYLDYDWPRAEEAFARAVRLDPSSAPAWRWYGRALAVAGRMEDAREAARRVERLGSRGADTLTESGWTLHLADRQPEAVGRCVEALQLRRDAYSAALCLLAAHVAMGNEPESAAAGQRVVTLLGADDEALRAAASARAAGDSRGYWRWMAGWLAGACPGGNLGLERALVHTLLGERAEAVEQLRSMVEARRPWAPFVIADPAFTSLRGHPGFQALGVRLAPARVSSPELSPSASTRLGPGGG